MVSEWEAAWTHDPWRKDKNMNRFLFGPENCVSCVGPQRGEGRRGGGGTATSEAIIWGWDHCLAPSLHAYGSERLSSPSSTTGCVISSLSPPRCARTFFFFFFKGILSILSAGCFSHHSLYLFSDNESIIFAVWKIDGFIRLCVLNVYHMMCAHALSEHGSEAAGR